MGRRQRRAEPFANVNKFAHIFKIDGLDKFGFLWEGVLGFEACS